jgi:hypothetical protein
MLFVPDGSASLIIEQQISHCTEVRAEFSKYQDSSGSEI